MIYNNWNATKGAPRVSLPQMQIQPVPQQTMVSRLFEGFSTTMTKVAKQRVPQTKIELN